MLLAKIQNAASYFGVEAQVAAEMNNQLRKNVVDETLFKRAARLLGRFIQATSRYEFECIVIIAWK